jgi:hypothetical protein
MQPKGGDAKRRSVVNPHPRKHRARLMEFSGVPASCAGSIDEVEFRIENRTSMHI